jgi:hypothetical protein
MDLSPRPYLQYKVGSALKAGHHNRAPLLVFTGTLFVCLGWALLSKYFVPEVIRSAYYGTSWQFLNRMVTGQATQPLSDYLGRWSVFAWDVLLVLLFAGLSATIAAWPQVRDAFWGKEPVSWPRPDTAPTAPEIQKGHIEPSRRWRLADFSRSGNMALLLGAIILVSLLLRVVLLGAKSFSEDEMFSVAIAHAHLLGFWETVTHQEANMILYYALLHFWLYIGQSELATRSLSVILAVATVPTVYWLGADRFGRKVGILGALLLAINGFHIEFSQDARSYSLLVFLVTLSSLFFLQCVREGSRRNWTRYIVASTLAIYAHLFAVLVLAAHWISLVFLPRDRVPWRRIVPSTAGIAFLALPMEMFVLRRNHNQLIWVQKTSLHEVYKFFTCLAGQPDRFSPLGHGAALLLLIYSIAVIVGILSLSQWRSSPRARAQAWYVAFFLTWLLVPILLILSISVWNPAFVPRFLIISLPPFILLAAYGISQLRRTWLVAAFLCLIAGLTVHGLLPYYHSPGEDWRGVVDYVSSNDTSRDAATFSPFYFIEKFSYYFQKEQRSAGASGPTLTLLAPSSDAFGDYFQNLSFRYDRVWFITRTKQPIKAITLQKRLVEATLGAEFTGVPKVRQFSGGLEVVLYSKKISQ